VNDSVNSNPVDGRVLAYRSLRLILIIAIIGVILKASCMDTILVHTDQMNPTLRRGDRTLVLRTAYRAPGAWFFSPTRGAPVLFDAAFAGAGRGVLRIAGMPGDTVRISRGALDARTGAQTHASRGRKPLDVATLPPSYSPRDSLAPYRVPMRGDSFVLEELPIRDLMYLFAIMNQEYPDRHYELEPLFLNEDSVLQRFVIDGFSLYSGPADSIPAALRRDWFFWDRLRAFLADGDSARVSLSLLVNENDAPLLHYTTRHDAYFLLADNWVTGMDSRYFGPVSENNLQGRVASILWSFQTDSSGRARLRGDRIVKLVH
jgi:signal peptidase I